MPIKLLLARQIFDATGIPTVEVDMVTELGLFRIAVPSLDPVRKSAEKIEKRDNNPQHYHGKGVTNAVKNINTIIAPELIKQNIEVTDQSAVDQFMIALDNTDNRSRLGANAMMVVSLVIARAGAAKKGLPLYRHLSDLADASSSHIIIPVPHFVILNGGILSSNGLPFQEYSIMPTGAVSFAEALKIGTEIYQYVKNVIIAKYPVECTYAGVNGGFSIPLQSHRNALLFLNDAIKQCRYNGRAEIAINAAASDLYKDGAYDLDFKNPNSSPQEFMSSDVLAELYLSNIKEFPVCSIEDAFEYDDWAAWSLLTSRISVQLLGNDLTQSSPRRIGLAVEKKAATSIALRLNQCGTLTELIESSKLLKGKEFGICCIDRWGDTADLFLAGLAVGLSAGQIKCGGPSRMERMDKYNEILRIEEESGSLAKYAGKNFMSPCPV